MTLKEIAENHGLTPQGVDYALTQYQIVMCEITHGMMSKLSYDAKDIIRIAQDRWCDTCDLKEPVEPYVEHDSDDDGWYYGCGACYEAIDYKDKFCRHCGKAVKWDAD